MSPNVEKLNTKLGKTIDIWKLNADEHTALMQSLGIFGIPTLLIYKAGEEVSRHSGALSLHALETRVRANLDPSTKLQIEICGPSRIDRLLRFGSGAVIVAYGWFSGPIWLLIGIGIVIAFTSIYDRCPIWQLVSARIKSLFQGITVSI